MDSTTVKTVVERFRVFTCTKLRKFEIVKKILKKLKKKVKNPSSHIKMDILLSIQFFSIIRVFIW
jgi:hypothetical protein